MRILIKYPTRQRPTLCQAQIQRYIQFANHPERLHFILSVDDDDTETLAIQSDLEALHQNLQVCIGESKGKVDAINRDMPDPSTFDLLLLVSDDMVPEVQGYDDVLEETMQRLYPDGDGVLFFNDGYCGPKLNTLVICGSVYYARFGYIYYPRYKSEWCDNEFMQTAYTLGKQTYFEKVLIRHESPYNNHELERDALLERNAAFNDEDKTLYYTRFPREYDISVLICTIPERSEMLARLLERIQRLTEGLRIRVEVLTDATVEYKVGLKRSILLSRARGNYCCFVDDDDDVTDDYFTPYEAVLPDLPYLYDCFALNGAYFVDGLYIKPFHHSMRYDNWSNDNRGYYRMPNHLNLIKTDICKLIDFISEDCLEDRDFSKRLLDSHYIQSEYRHNFIQYLYYFRMIKKNTSPWVPEKEVPEKEVAVGVMPLFSMRRRRGTFR